MAYRNLFEDLEINDIELEDENDILKDDDFSILEVLESMLMIYDENDELIPFACFASTIADTFDVSESQVAEQVKGNPDYKIYKITSNESGINNSLVIGNKASTEDTVKGLLNNIYDEEDDITFDIIELKEKEEEVPEAEKEHPLDEGAQGKKVSGKEFVIYDTSKEDEKVAPIVAIRKTYVEAQWFCNKPKNFGKELGIEEVPEGKFKVGDDFYGPFDANWEKIESLKEEAMYGLYVVVKATNGEVVKDKKLLLVDNKQECEKKKEHLEEVSHKDINGNVNVYTVEFIGNSSYDNPENPNESLKEEEDLNYFILSDGYDPRNSLIIPYGETTKEEVINIAKESEGFYKYVSRYEKGKETVIWHAEDFNPKGMDVKLESKLKGKMEVSALDKDGNVKEKELIEIDGEYNSEEILKKFFELHPECKENAISLNFKEEALKEEIKEGPSNLFGYINGDLKSFEPKNFVEKVKNAKQSLHTNRMIKDTNNEKICHTIAIDILGLGDEPKVFVDVIEEVWTRDNDYDADDARNYQGKTSQTRLLSQSCGKGEEGFNKAIEVLEKYKKEQLNKFESATSVDEDLEEDYYDEPAVKVAKKIAKALKLSKYDLNTLIHDINNLRGSEWLEQVESIGDEELLKQFKEVAQLDLEEDIEKHDELNPVLFDGEELKPEIKDALQKIVDTFVEDLKENEVDIKVKDIVLVGSNVSYNYTKDSDLDLHIIADSNGTDYPSEFATLLYSAYRSIFNKNYDITLKGIPVEVYVEMDNLGAAKSNGQYSLNSGWLKKPSKEDIPDVNLNQEEFEKLFSEWEDKYFNLLNEIGINPEEILTLVEKEDEEASEKVKDFIEDIYELRKTSIANDGEYGVGNLVFKEFRNLGYLDGLKELRKKLKGKELSLESLNEEFSKKALNKIYKYTLDNHGGTFDVKTGESLSGSPLMKNVYSVEFKSKDWRKRIEQVDKQVVLDTLNDLSNSEEAKIADAIGTWSSDENERPQSSVGLDKFFLDREEAEKFALEHKQKAIGVFNSRGEYSNTIYKKDFKYKEEK